MKRSWARNTGVSLLRDPPYTLFCPLPSVRGVGWGWVDDGPRRVERRTRHQFEMHEVLVRRAEPAEVSGVATGEGANQDRGKGQESVGGEAPGASPG